ncbi:GT2 family glycosyltransferase [Mycetocola sp. CAN_C7]|uniref:glycosyltransferase family 2 protein n=1 Tax=Mycetocola sp. CAN_C7 TaxID=2787724 RepID=UPI0018CA87B1
MSPRVTAILVVHDGTGTADAGRLQSTLDALAAQTRQPDTVIAVACAAPAATTLALEKASVDRIVTSGERLNFGQALSAGIRVVEQPDSADEFLWLLAQDTPPEPTALARLLGAIEVAPSVAIAGPKLMEAADGSTIVSLGESVTPFGATVPLVEDELDQGQHDSVSDVLAVAPAGMLVRHTVWEEIGGFDTAFGSADDALDFSTRARLAGHRVTVVPSAVVLTAGSGIAGPSRSDRPGARRKRARQSRAAQLYRRLVYAPTAAVWLHWLSLVPLGILRGIRRIVVKQPDLVGSELAAAFRVAFSPLAVLRARKRLQASRKLGWSSLSALRIPFAEVRRRRRLRRESGVAVHAVERTDLRFFTGGGGWLVLASAAASVGLFFSLLAASAVEGGSLLPLSAGVAELWQHIGYGVREIGLGFTGAADPFSAVLAVLGSITFWSPSYALVLVTLLALPLATLGGWFAATRLTERSGYRFVAAILWTLAPTFLSALVGGQLSGILVHLLLPWLFYSGCVAARSWGSAGVASILLAATIATAPSLAPAFLLIWVVALVLSGRHLARVIWLVIPAAVLFAPLVWQQGVLNQNWIRLLADPGVPVASARPTGWQLLQSLPAGNPWWDEVANTVGLGGLPAHILVPVLLAPLAVMALLALFLPGNGRAAVLLFVGLLGLLTAFGASHLYLTVSGSTPTAVWAGSALSLYWLGLAGAAVVGFDSLRRAATLPALVVGMLAVILAVPMAGALPTGNGEIAASNGRTLPAYVTAAASAEPLLRTLILSPQADGGVSARVIDGIGDTLDNSSTLVTTNPDLTENDQQVAVLAGNLVSQGGLDPSSILSDFGVEFILLTDPADASGNSVTPAAQGMANRAATSLDSNAVLAHVGPTDRGTLWRFEGETAPVPTAGAVPFMSTLVLLSLVVVFGFALLLSIPTAASRRAAEGRPRTIGRREAEPAPRLTRAERAEEKAEAEAERSVELKLAAESEEAEAREAEQAAADAAEHAADSAGASPDDRDGGDVLVPDTHAERKHSDGR